MLNGMQGAFTVCKIFWVNMKGKRKKPCKLIEDGEVLVQGVDLVWWHGKGVYKYGMEGEELVTINKNK